ncbi:MAG: DUF4372 domain-containing protein [Pseudomonadota bacterium]|nr:DUF4372 domain-containing protein [Pseudomonadota bacterium]
MIQIGSEGLATHLNTKGINAVWHKNSVFRDLLKLIPWASFDRLVEEHGSDALGRKFKSREQVIALLYGQLAGATLLRDIIAGLSRHQARLYHIGGKVPARSTFADANRDRSYEAFSGLFVHMLGMATRGLKPAALTSNSVGLCK